MEMVDFDRPKFKRLKQRYNVAVENKEEAFVFEGHEYLTAYAKYLIEYLENVFGRMHGKVKPSYAKVL